jgi:hypothetical protein
VVMFFGDFFQFRYIEQSCEIVEVEHGLVLAVFAKERNVFAEVHVLEMICDKAAVATLNAFAEFCDDFLLVGHVYFDFFAIFASFA